ncbi:hypothetical protein Ancab_000473 [Ancistrocladus abbreviatus]
MAHEKKERAILEKCLRRRRVWCSREDSMAWKGLWCSRRILEINSASFERRSVGSVGLVGGSERSEQSVVVVAVAEAAEVTGEDDEKDLVEKGVREEDIARVGTTLLHAISPSLLIFSFEV